MPNSSTSNTNTNGNGNNAPPQSSSQVSEDIQMERMRAAAEPAQVKPMRTDYHFFVDDMRESIQELAAQEVRSPSVYLLYSNMNARLIKAWEDASSKTRAHYAAQEEEDRRRFMNDEEIASRHCATLTARARSPRPGTLKAKDVKEEDDDEEDEEKKKKRSSPTNSSGTSTESPPKRNRTEGSCADDDDEDEENVETGDAAN